jgi:energy-coupling factor transporter ATP-binding protein EcfA2
VRYNVKAFIHSQFTAFPGQTTVCYGASGSGKTTAAVYLLRGDYPHRPKRAIMIAAAGSADIIATSFGCETTVGTGSGISNCVHLGGGRNKAAH